MFASGSGVKLHMALLRSLMFELTVRLYLVHVSELLVQNR